MTAPKDLHRPLTAERLRALLDYDPASGVMKWRIKPKRSNICIGDIAGYKTTLNRWRIKIDGWFYFRSRLAFLYMNDCWPRQQIDHRNGDPLDDRWENLREASPSQNTANGRRSNALGVRGVRLMPNGKYRASIEINGRTVHLGIYATAAEANFAYQIAAVRQYGEFAFHCRSAA